MKKMIPIRTIVAILLRCVAGFVVLYLLAAFLLSLVTIPAETNAPGELAIYTLNNGVHTDIVVPLRTGQYDWSRVVKYKYIASKDTAYQFLAIGWGNKEFYLNTPTWADLKLSIALKAAFGFGSPAIHTSYYKDMVESEDCKKIMISKEQYSRLINFISGSFRKDNNGDFIHIQTTMNYGDNDAFYEAEGCYCLFFTCNSWYNKALKLSGQKCRLWKVF